MKTLRKEPTLKDFRWFHGIAALCPCCHALGTLDLLDTEMATFEDSIWWNSELGCWECVECWLK